MWKKSISNLLTKYDNNATYYHNLHNSIEMARGDSRPIKHSSNAILSFSSVCITSLCLVFVIWKSSKCLSKFFDKPQVTELSVQKAANFPFPAITICSVFGGLGEYQRFNTTYLEDVCGFRYTMISIHFSRHF